MIKPEDLVAARGRSHPEHTEENRQDMIDWENLSLKDAHQIIRKLQQELEAKEQQLSEHNSELALLNRVTQAFNSTLDLDQILITVLEEVRRLLEVDACSIWMRDMKTDELVCEYAIGPYSQAVRGWRLASGQGIAGSVAQSGESVIVPDVLIDERHFKGVDQRTGQTLRSILCVAMKVKQQVIGVLQVLDSEVNRFSHKDQVLQELLATAAAIAIKNARLNEKIWQAAETKSLLVHEINQRGKNNLAVISDLLEFTLRYEHQKNHQDMMVNLINQVKTLETANKLLAEFEWNPFSLSELSNRVIHASLKELASPAKIFVAVSPSPVRISPQYANSLSLLINELVTNTVKHAMQYQSRGHISVHVTRMNHTIHFEFRDDGPGYPENMLQFNPKGSGMGFIQKIVQDDLHGELTLYNDNGAVTVLRFKSKNGGQETRYV